MAVKSELKEKVKLALLSMQRHSWEQGVAAQAFLEQGEEELVVLFAKEAALRQQHDGRVAVMASLTASTDPAANGEALIYASRVTGDKKLEDAYKRLADWLLNKAPRNREGLIFHFDDSEQIWVDSFYMGPPFLSLAGYPEEALKQITGYRRLLFNPDKKLFSHMWDENKNCFARKDFWGVGNGWALAGMSRVIKSLPQSMSKEKALLIGFVKDCLDGCIAYLSEDGLFHDVLDNQESFVETNTSQMVAYTIYRGLQQGWLDKSYLEYAERMRAAAISKVDEYGLVQGVCSSPFFDRPGTATEGQAFFLLMEAAACDYYRICK